MIDISVSTWVVANSGVFAAVLDLFVLRFLSFYMMRPPTEFTKLQSPGLHILPENFFIGARYSKL